MANLIEKGVCLHGHKINGLDDVWQDVREARIVFQCRECRRLRRQARNADKRKGGPRAKGQYKRYVNLSCGHTPVFTPMLPAVSDVIYCTVCNDEAKVESWGEIIAPTNHELSTLYETSGFCRKGHPYSAENTKVYTKPNGYRTRVCQICLGDSRERNKQRRLKS